MTAAAAASSAPTVNATAASSLESAHHLPIHHAPSLQDLLEHKRQRISLDEGPRPEPEQTLPGEPRADAAAAEGTTGDLAFLSAADFTSPVLPCIPGEPMSSYFSRLREALASSAATGGSHLQEPQPVTSLDREGIYLVKRPIRAPNGASPLAVCGSVLHHVVVLVKEGSQLYTLDFGPANGADVTANILEEAAPKKVLEVGDVSTAAGPDGAEQMPYLYLGPATCGVNHPLVQQLITFAESRPYHALGNNCIHFADALVRVLTAGTVRAAPLLYDIKCGAVPPVDNPMLMMMQLMLRMPWFVAVDGSRLTSAFLEHHNAAKQPQQPQQPSDPRVAEEDAAEDAANDNGTSPAGDAATAAAAADTQEAAAVPAPAAADVTENKDRTSTSCSSREGSSAAAAAVRATCTEQPAAPQGRDEVGLGQADEELRQEQHNDQAAGGVAAMAEVEAL